MVSKEKQDNTMHFDPRHIRRGAVIVLASLILSTQIVHAEPSTLRANPVGSVSVDLPSQNLAEQTNGNMNSVGPPVGPLVGDPSSGLSGDVASVLDLEPKDPAPPKTETESKERAASVASKPLGAPAAPIIGDSQSSTKTDTSGGGWGVRTALALAAVIGLILLCKFVFLKLASRGGGSIASQLGPSGRAPSGLLSVLARYPIAKGSTLVLLRLDRRVLLLSQTGQGFTTLSEIDDPEEVAALIMRAEDEEGASLTRRFRTMLSQAERDPGLIGEQEFEIETAVPMTPRVATARFHELAMDAEVSPALDANGDPVDHADAVGSLRNRLRSLREVTA